MEPVNTILCSKCGKSNANPGKSWCQKCYEMESKRCTECKINISNPGKTLCGTCYLKSQLCLTCNINRINVGTDKCASCLLDVSQLQSIEDFVKEIEELKKVVISKQPQKTTISSTLRHEVWKKFISDKFRKGKCFCCRTTDIEESNFECGHVISRSNGGAACLQNLRPICSQCNKSMSSENMDEFIVRCGFWGICELQKQPLKIFYNEFNGKMWCSASNMTASVNIYESDYATRYKWVCCNSTAKFPEDHINLTDTIPKDPSLNKGKLEVKLQPKKEIKKFNSVNCDKIELNNYTVAQLQQLCWFIDVSPCGTKLKIISKIESKLSAPAMLKTINKIVGMQYFVRCDHENDVHQYYTNKTFTAGKCEVGGRVCMLKNSKCFMCKKISECVSVYYNLFFDEDYEIENDNIILCSTYHSKI